MKLKQLTLTLAALVAFACGASAQTYNLIGPVGGGHVSAPLRLFNIPFTEGNEISWFQTGGLSRCYGAPVGAGFVYVNGSACIPLETVTFSGTAGTGNCSGPATLSATWDGGEAVLNMNYYRAGYGRNAGCYEDITSGTLTIN